MRKTLFAPLYRIISVILSIIVLAGLLSCGTTTKDADATMPSGTESTTAQDVDPRLSISDELPERDFGGYEFRVAARDRDDFVMEVGSQLEESGEIISDAIYARNKTVEDRFNIKITSVHNPLPQKTVKDAVLAGDDSFDLLLGQVVEMGPTVLEGNYLNWFTLPYVKLDKPWYINNASETMSVNNKAYIMSGEYCLSILRFTYCVYFNKTLMKDFGIPDPYKTVNDGKWTIDYFNEIVKKVHSDVNGDGVMDENDLYGFTSDFYSAAVTYQYAFDNPVFKKDSSGELKLSYYSPKMIQIVDKVYELFYGNEGSYVGTWGVSGPIWQGGRAMLLNGIFESAVQYRSSDIDFGILPYPKFDEQQEKYLTMSDGAHSIMAVPVTVSDPERTSIIIEALNAESYKQVVPAYYEKALKVKYSRDNESVKILDIILDGRYFDFGYIYDGWKGFAFVLQELTSSKSKDFVSLYEKKETSASKYYQTILDMYDEAQG
jgi:ABC-type glycerol-3-phosphate transport system substrate-binding protein